MTSLLRPILRRLGLVVVRDTNVNVRYLTSPPLTPFDEMLYRVFRSLEGLSFVQVGANDGRRVDPIRRHIEAFHWRGVFVEPDPRFFAQLQQNYREQNHCTFLNVALDTAAGPRTLHFVRPDLPGLPDWVHGVGSFDRNHVLTVVERLGLPASAVASREIAAITWADLFAQLGFVRPDVIVIDTEGHDAALLDALDFGRHGPRVLHFEHAHCTSAERLRLYGKLLEHGYELASYDGDTTAYKLSP